MDSNSINRKYINIRIIIWFVIFLTVYLLINELDKWCYINGNNDWFIKNNGNVIIFYEIILLIGLISILDKLVKKSNIYKFGLVLLFEILSIISDFLYKLIMEGKISYHEFTVFEVMIVVGMYKITFCIISFAFYKAIKWAVLRIKNNESI